MKSVIDRMRERAEAAERERDVLLAHVARLREAARVVLSCHSHTLEWCEHYGCNCGLDALDRAWRETDPFSTDPADPGDNAKAAPSKEARVAAKSDGK